MVSLSYAIKSKIPIFIKSIQKQVKKESQLAIKYGFTYHSIACRWKH